MPTILILTEHPALGSMLAEQLGPIGTVLRLPNQAIPDDIGTKISPPLIVLVDSGFFNQFLPEIKQLKASFSSAKTTVIGLQPQGMTFSEPELLYATYPLPLHLPGIMASISDLASRLAAAAPEQIALGTSCTLLPLEKRLLAPDTDDSVPLTDIECRILLYLHQAQSRMPSRDELLKNVWGYNEQITTHTLETHIYRLRNKLASLPGSQVEIIGESGGYKLVFAVAQS